MIISLVAAMDRHRLIGKANSMPWHLPADLKHFREITWGKPILMGRKTFESLGQPLPGRTNIVVTRNPGYMVEGIVVVHSVEDALQAAGEVEEVMIIGGASFYAQCLPLAQRLYLTRVAGEFEGDTWFPEFDAAQWREVAREDHLANEHNPYAYSFTVLERA